jgi:hypothetical protein
MNVTPSIGRFLFLGVGIVAALVMAVAGVMHREPGHAISSIGVALLAVVVYLEPGPLLQPFGRRFLKVESASSQTAVLSAVGVLLLFVGLGIRWAW